MTVHIGAKPGDIAETVLLPGDPYRARWAAQTFLQDAVLVNEVRGMLGYTGTWRGNRVTIHGSGMGMPSLSIYANELMKDIKGFIPVGVAKDKVSVLSFNINGMHPFDVGQMLDAKGIAVRTGHHCTQPLMKRFGIEGTVRASFAVYNTKSEIEKLAEGVAQIARLKNK